MIVLVCGDRNWTDFETIDKFLATLPQNSDTQIIEGDCKGADKISGYLAEKRGMTVIREPAKWNKYGLRAGPIRNQLMLDKYHPNIVIAFHNDLNKSRGTKNMVNLANLCNIPVKIFKSGET